MYVCMYVCMYVYMYYFALKLTKQENTMELCMCDAP